MEYYNDELMHYGVKGMKWGVRRRSDQPTFRQASKKARADGLAARKAARDSGQLNGIGAIRKGNKIQRDAAKASLKEQKQAAKQQKKPMSTKKKVAIGAAATAAIVGGAYGAYKLNKLVKNKNFNIARENGRKAADKWLSSRGAFESVGYSTYKDGRSVLNAKMMDGTSNTMHFKNKDSAKKAYDMYKSQNQMLEDSAQKIRDSYLNKARNESFRSAAKNVLKYYRNR